VNKSAMARALKRAASDQGLISKIPPVVAYSFGVIPLSEKPERMWVACYPEVNPDCIDFLCRHLSKEVRALACDSELMDKYLGKIYPRQSGVNMNTFESPDFIKDPNNAALLTSEKVDALGEIRSDLKLEELVVFDMCSESYLKNLDQPAVQENISIGDLEIPFCCDGEDVIVWGTPVEESVLLMGRRDYFFDGCEQHHGIVSYRSSALPLVIHASEVQITRIDGDGGLTFYLYDHHEEVKPGGTLEWRKKYYFLHQGNRLCRELAIKVRKTQKVMRRDLKYSLQPLDWTPEDLSRWLRLDCSCAYPNLAERDGRPGAGNV